MSRAKTEEIPHRQGCWHLLRTVGTMEAVLGGEEGTGAGRLHIGGLGQQALYNPHPACPGTPVATYFGSLLLGLFQFVHLDLLGLGYRDRKVVTEAALQLQGPILSATPCAMFSDLKALQ